MPRDLLAEKNGSLGAGTPDPQSQQQGLESQQQGLESKQDTIDSMESLSAVPKHVNGNPDLASAPARVASHGADPRPSVNDENDPGGFPMRGRRQENARGQLHALAGSLTFHDMEECVALENAAFPEHMRASREKFAYRLQKCSHLALGLYTSYYPEEEQTPSDPLKELKANAATAPHADTIETPSPPRKKVLLAHIISTMSKNETIKDTDMAIPSSTPEPTSEEPGFSDYEVVDSDKTTNPIRGHDDKGKTICLHSLAVLPAFQKRGLGMMILKEYIQRMEQGGLGDRIALLCVEKLVPFYEKAGFINYGKSEATFGGEEWYDMVISLKTQKQQMKERDEAASKRVHLNPRELEDDGGAGPPKGY